LPTPQAAGEIGVQLGRALFQNLLLAQGLAVVFLTPALLAGAIAGEYQRRTLHELLASDLSSAQIVPCKLGARLSHTIVLLATGLPPCWQPGSAAVSMRRSCWRPSRRASASTAFFLGALTILASTQTRSVRGAMNFTFTLLLTWLILRGSAGVLVPWRSATSQAVYRWLGPVNAWVSATSPFALWISTIRCAARFPEPPRSSGGSPG
jgi:hypothetical protein